MPDIDIRTWVIRNRLMCKWQIALIQNKSIQYCSSSESRGARHKECQLPEHRSTSMSVESCRRSVDTLQQHSPTTLHAVPLHMTSDCNLHVCLKLAGWANQQWASQYCCTELVILMAGRCSDIIQYQRYFCDKHRCFSGKVNYIIMYTVSHKKVPQHFQV